MLQVIILLTLVAVFVYACEPVLFNRGPLLSKLKRLLVPISIFRSGARGDQRLPLGSGGV